MNSILYELTQTIFMDINASGLTMVNVAFHNRWIGTGFHLKSSNAIIVNVILFEITLRNDK